MIGTQQINRHNSLSHMADDTKRMRSRIIKCKYSDPDTANVFMDPFFTHYFIWYRSHGENFINGVTCEDVEYWETYQYITELLKKFNGTQKKFFIGNWEGDWYLLPGKNKTIDAPQYRVNGMIDWINIRYKALCDARRNHPSTVKVYYYVELNRLMDAMNGGYRRLVNAVLPHVTVDFVSLSSYDIQDRPKLICEKAISFVEKHANFSKLLDEEWTRRVFIGEFGIPSCRFDYDDVRHRNANIEVMDKYLSLGCPFVLYWAMYNNELLDNGEPKGLWLINNKGRETLLYQYFKKYAEEFYTGLTGDEKDKYDETSDVYLSSI